MTTATFSADCAAAGAPYRNKTARPEQQAAARRTVARQRARNVNFLRCVQTVGARCGPNRSDAEDFSVLRKFACPGAIRVPPSQPRRIAILPAATEQARETSPPRKKVSLVMTGIRRQNWLTAASDVVHELSTEIAKSLLSGGIADLYFVAHPFHPLFSLEFVSRRLFLRAAYLS